MATTLINIGATANDGTGDPIRDAFNTANENFTLINGAIFSGIEPTIISAVSVTADEIVSNTFIVAGTYINANSLVGDTVTSHGNLYVSQDGAYIIGNVSIIGNLSVTGSQQSTQSSSATAPIILIHANAAPYTLNDGKDIGLEWQYYDTADKYGFLGRQNSSGSLVYLDNVTDTSNVITAGTFGNVQFGQLLLSNTTSSTSNVTGALQVRGGAGIQGNVYVQSNVFVGNTANIGNLVVRGNVLGSMYFDGGSDTIYVGGSPVVTSATSFNGGPVGLPTTFNDTTQSTSAISGAVQIRGGLGVAGNVWVGNLQSNIGGNVRANIQGNIFTPAQPFITSLGTLTGLSVAGQFNAQDIVPTSGSTYSLGSGTTTRWNKIWTFDMDLSGTLTGGTINSAGGAHTGNIAINTSTNSGLTTTQATAYVFNETATTVRIGGSGVTQFNNNTKATSTSTGAVQIKGGVSINSGNLYVGGSAGTAIVVTGNIVPSGNVVSTNNLGSDTAWWNNFYGVSVQARYADLAENYVPDSEYKPGTVVVFGGESEITTTNIFADVRVAGVVSTNPGYLMNASSPGIPIALRGRVPVQVHGAVQKGDLLVTSPTPGFAMSVGQNNTYGHAVFAKSLVTNGSNGYKVIEAVII